MLLFLEMLNFDKTNCVQWNLKSIKTKKLKIPYNSANNSLRGFNLAMSYN